MRVFRYLYFCFSIFLLLFLLNCKPAAEKQFSAEAFVPISNYETDAKQKNISLDYYDAIRDGFVIPTVRQLREGKFAFSFSIKNNSGSDKKFYYKIYYQNETYKFPDDHEYAHENFYGSWEEVSKEFVETPLITSNGEAHIIIDSLRITGNPRDEKKYYGISEDITIQDEVLKEYVGKIYNNAEWLNKIKDNAKANKLPLLVQLRRDAGHAYDYDRSQDEPKNFKWKRNPRVGEYSFMVVITTEEELKIIPPYIKNISIPKDSFFENPYTYFLHGPGKNLNNTIVLKSENILKVKASPDLSAGIFINRRRYPDADTNSWQYTGPLCNSAENMYYHAPFQQYIHWIDTASKMQNIPLVWDVESYTKQAYLKNKNAKTKPIEVPIKVSECPCKTVSVDTVNRSVRMHNPATKAGEWRKENVGIISRHGFTYGKHTVKIKMPELLNRENIWNGLTNAIWLIYQGGTWNTRRACDTEGGYIPKNTSGAAAKKERILHYTEIDFEIVKATRYWPKTSYPNGSSIPEESPTDSSNIMVTCTNWDMACMQPPNYGVGVHTIEHKDNKFELHRWDHWYQALTSKYAANDDELFAGEYYYFQIDWRPTEIIWRIGPSKDKLREVAYMDASVTSIPNNQMLLIITQEYHLANWWPDAPFSQDHVPFPAKDIIGEVYEYEIE